MSSVTPSVSPQPAPPPADEPLQQLPIIDLQNFAFDEAGLDRIAGHVDRVFSDIGFCYLANTGVPIEQMQAVFAASKAFHAQPQAAKDTLAINDFHRGYMAPKTSVIVTSSVAKVTKPNNSESLMVMHEVAEDDPRFGQALQGPNQWPADLPGFRDTVAAYNAALQGLAQRFTQIIARALGFAPEALDRFFERPTTFLRLLHYPSHPDAAEDEFGSAPHTDYGFITILLQDGVGGLEVRRRGGGWIRATPIPGTFVVNVGDILSRWTNGRWQSTPHRVQNKATIDRYSVPFFFDPDMAETISCLPGLVPAGETPRFEPVIYGDYLMERIDKNYQYRKTAG
ncbi:isopenicillin N synthase family dioxygenase [Labrys wisconsinensis]|uniref:2-oxoglutarate-dependent ethylene/succinate-forming enzyme n=1 Tax=Labrys wisconsinensis TaxID=425677 RepID=A0ABU0J917_9HYPH|nr:2OG-Fe(II) oxygenase family protein [Labrys wisconsinensis]MDQ0470766.1 isopenicillin N synthase-like dioxygenase [Labrys wisconsinensis]